MHSVWVTILIGIVNAFSMFTEEDGASINNEDKKNFAKIVKKKEAKFYSIL